MKHSAMKSPHATDQGDQRNEYVSGMILQCFLSDNILKTIEWDYS